MKELFDSRQLFDTNKDRYLYKSIFELLHSSNATQKEHLQEDLFSLILAKAPFMTYVKDEDLELVYTNPKYECFLYTNPNFQTALERFEKEALEGKRVEAELNYNTKVLDVSILPLHHNAKRLIVGFLQDKTLVAKKFEYLNNLLESLKRRYRYFKRCSTIDSLTQALNKGEFEKILYKECERSKRYGLPLSLILFDLDNFKWINDRFGHVAGDTVLQAVAQTVQKRTRKTDFFARIGGDEFAILAPGTKKEDAIALTQKIKESIDHLIFQSLDFGTVGCSFGICQYRSDEDPVQFLDRTDRALYKSKKNGRGRISWLE